MYIWRLRQEAQATMPNSCPFPSQPSHMEGALVSGFTCMARPWAVWRLVWWIHSWRCIELHSWIHSKLHFNYISINAFQFISFTFQFYSNFIPITFQWHSNFIPIPFQKHSKFIPVTFQFHFNYIPITFQLHSNYIRCYIPGMSKLLMELLIITTISCLAKTK